MLKQFYLLSSNIKISKLLRYKQKTPLLKQLWNTAKNFEIFQPMSPFRTTLGHKSRKNQHNTTFGCRCMRLYIESKHKWSALKHKGKPNLSNKLSHLSTQLPSFPTDLPVINTVLIIYMQKFIFDPWYLFCSFFSCFWLQWIFLVYLCKSHHSFLPHSPLEKKK